MWTLTARWIFPVDGPPLKRGTVTIDGERIVGLAAHGWHQPDVDLGEAAVLPGLVNAHTHLDLSGMRGLAPPSPDFTAWLRQVITFRRQRTPEQVREDIRASLEECLRYGTTLVGDIAAEGSSWETLVNAPLRAEVFYEVLGLTQERADRAYHSAAAWLDAHTPTETCRPALSPHAPYSASRRLYFLAVHLAWNRQLSLATHLAESQAELEVLRHRRGPFVQFLSELGVWNPEDMFLSPAGVLRSLSASTPLRQLIVHGNYLPRLTRLPKYRTLIYCPRTHAAFGHSPHPFRDFLARRARVAIGTDSLASNPDLDILAEIRFLRRQYPDIPGGQLLQMATLSGAEALGWQDTTGSLRAGKSADLVVVPLTTGKAADPHELFLQGNESVRDVLFRGHWVCGPLAETPGDITQKGRGPG
jgi:aminodeoxyfutalosine deaminase